MPEPSEAERLRQEITRQPSLSVEKAELRLPELAMAELRGENVAVMFADVLDAIGRYPQLADEYELLLADMDLLFDPSAGDPVPQAPWLAADPARLDERYTLRVAGQRADYFLLQCHQPPVAAAAVSHRSGPLALLHTVVRELAGAPEIQVSLRAYEKDRWQLSVLASAADESPAWRITAVVDGVDLGSAERDGDTWLFGRPFAYPADPILLFFDSSEG